MPWCLKLHPNFNGNLPRSSWPLNKVSRFPNIHWLPTKRIHFYSFDGSLWDILIWLISSSGSWKDSLAENQDVQPYHCKFSNPNTSCISLQKAHQHQNLLAKLLQGLCSVCFFNLLLTGTWGNAQNRLMDSRMDWLSDSQDVKKKHQES